MLLPPATKLGQGYVFTGFCDSVHRGEYLTRYTPQDRVHPPGPGTPPGMRHTPLGPGTPRPPGTRYTPQIRYTPQDQVHPLGPGTPPGTRYTPRTRRYQWQIQDFPEEGVPTLQGGPNIRFCQIFPKTA